jgi:hypothetical protein
MTVIPFRSRRSPDELQASINDARNDLIPDADIKHTHAADTQPGEFEATVTNEEWIKDVEELGTNALKRKYRLTYNSFNNLADRARKLGAEIHPEFRTFKSFLLSVGPRRRKELTLNRKDNANPLYGPGLCEWANKSEQARNRRSTIFLIRPETGEKVALVALAEELDVPASRLRRQYHDGWTFEEMLAGKRLTKCRVTVSPVDRWPWDLEPQQKAWWEEQYRKHRRPATETGLEFRYEFALRSIRVLEQENLKFINDAWERFGSQADETAPASDGRDQMPVDVREKYDRVIILQAKVKKRIREAEDGEGLWRASVTERMRPRISWNERDNY